MMMMFDQEGYDETALLAQIRAGATTGVRPNS
jgi:hypothetical protein